MLDNARPRALVPAFFRTAGLAIAAVSGLAAIPAAAQSITVSIVGTSNVGFSLTPGSALNFGSNPVTVLTVAALGAGPPVNMSLHAYFGDANAALTYLTVCGSCPNIPASAVEVSVNGAGFLPINQPGPFSPNADRLLWALPSPTGRSPMARNGTRAVTLTFNINLSTLPDIAAGNYSGTLFVQAQAVT